jgi:hypothetical protein
MIEIRAVQTEAGFRAHRLILDGVEVSREHAYSSGAGRRDVSAIIYGEEALTLLRRQRITDIPPELTRLSIDRDHSDRELNLRVRPTFTRTEIGAPVRLSFVFVFRVHVWKRPWSMGEMRDAARTTLLEGNIEGLEWNTAQRPMPSSITNFTVDVSSIDERATIGELLDTWSPRVSELVSQVERELATRARPDSLVALFDFPVEVRTPCEQYLLYFVEFLRDVGVEAQADVTHDAGRVLFSVTPQTGAQALDRIREALEAYLELPAAGDLGDLTSFGTNPRVQQLVANIQHLKGQLYIASAALQLKDATIAQLSDSRGSGTHLALTGEVVQTSLKAIDAPGRSDDVEEVIPGLVKLSEFKAKGVSINLAELYRRLRQLLLGPPSSDDDEASGKQS